MHAVDLPRFTYDACGVLPDGGGGMLVAGAKNPSWGPADVPAERPVKQPEQKPEPIEGGPTPVEPSQNDKPLVRGVRLAVTAPRLKVALRRGFTVKLTGAKPGRHTVVAKLAGRKVASGKAVVGADGTGKVTLKFTAVAKRKLARKKTAVLSITGAVVAHLRAVAALALTRQLAAAGAAHTDERTAHLPLERRARGERHALRRDDVLRVDRRRAQRERQQEQAGRGRMRGHPGHREREDACQAAAR